MVLTGVVTLFLYCKISNSELLTNLATLSILISTLGISITGKLADNKKYILIQLLVTIPLTILIYEFLKG